jgi:hypothetical protein
MKRIILLSIITLFSVSTLVQAKNYYIRISTNTSDWSNITADGTHVIVDYTAGTSSLSTIINSYVSNDVVWIAKGTYKITAAIAVKAGMSIVGGFAGSENTVSSRSITDLNANGIVEPWEFTNATEITSDNGTPTFSAMNIGTSVTNATVDGVTIKGITITSTIGQLIKIYDTATGSILKNSILKDCSVSGTIALNGIIYANNGTIQNCLIQGNTITATTSTNSSLGGGISLTSLTTSSTAPQVIGCVICGNKVTNTAGTTTKSKGGGVFVQSYSAALSCKVINCVIYNNEAMTQGGGLYINDAYGEAINCTVAKNTCGQANGGGVYLNGGGLLNNSIVWGNMHNASATATANDIYTSVSNSNQNYLAYGISSGTWGGLTATKILTSGVSADNTTDGSGTLAPKFINPTTAVGAPTDGTTTTAMTQANFKLGATSPGLDYSSNNQLNTLSITTDLMGSSRFMNTTADLGAYELPFLSGSTNVSSLLDCSTCDVNVQNGGTLTIDASATLKSLIIERGGKVTNNSGQTLTASSLTINSDASGTGTYVDNGTTAITTATVNQYLTAGRNWYISSPVSGATSNVFNAVSNGLYYYDETNGATSSLAWPRITDNSTGLTIMKGYVANISGSNPLTVTFTGGTLNTGPKSISGLTSSSTVKQGFNLVGNPYPSFLDWDAATKTNLSSTIWYRSKSTGAYLFQTYNKADGIGTNGATNLIPPMQSFWVLVNPGQTGTLAVDNSMRSHQDQSIASNRLKAPAMSLQQVLRLQVSNGVNSDETIVLFNPNASDAIDDYDSPKMSNNNAAIPELYTFVENKQLVINGLSQIYRNQEIPLGFTTGQSNVFSIKATEINNFGDNTQIILKDNQTNNEWNLTDGSAYNFSSDISSSITNRFSIVFKSADTSTGNIITGNNLNSIQIYKNDDNKITINCTNGILGQATALVYNEVGQKLDEQTLQNSKTVLSKSFLAGVYIVNVNVNGKSTTQKVVIK